MIKLINSIKNVIDRGRPKVVLVIVTFLTILSTVFSGKINNRDKDLLRLQNASSHSYIRMLNSSSEVQYYTLLLISNTEVVKLEPLVPENFDSELKKIIERFNTKSISQKQALKEIITTYQNEYRDLNNLYVDSISLFRQKFNQKPKFLFVDLLLVANLLPILQILLIFYAIYLYSIENDVRNHS